MKKAKYIGKEKMDFLIADNDIDLIPGKIYDVLQEDSYWYRVVDESGEDYRYPKSFFEIVK